MKEASAAATAPGNEAIAATPAINRPSVLSLSIKERSALYSAYMPLLKNAGIFVPTNKSYKLGDEIYLILSLMDDPNKYPIAGKVAWITPANAQNNKTQGIGVHFPDDESGKRVKHSIEELLGSALHSNRATHTF
ncbi:MAG: PilZ domain-containing protein [Burkholderiaceae bacterium]